MFIQKKRKSKLALLDQFPESLAESHTRVRFGPPGFGPVPTGIFTATRFTPLLLDAGLAAFFGFLLGWRILGEARRADQG